MDGTLIVSERRRIIILRFYSGKLYNPGGNLLNQVLIATAIEKGDRDEDRLAVQRTATGLIVVVADGAGGVGGGAVAAQCICDLLIGRPLETGRSAEDWVTALQNADRKMLTSREGGLTTAVYVSA